MNLVFVLIIKPLPDQGLYTMSAPERKPSARGRPSLVAAAAQSSSSSATPPQAGSSQAQPSSSNPLPARMTSAAQAARPSPAARSTLSGSGTPTSSLPDQPSQAIPKMKFKPKVPIRRVVKQYVPSLRFISTRQLTDHQRGGRQACMSLHINSANFTEPIQEVSSGPAMRGGGTRGRGRGGSSRGRGAAPVAYQSLPAGPFGGPRPASSEHYPGLSPNLHRSRSAHNISISSKDRFRRQLIPPDAICRHGAVLGQRRRLDPDPSTVSHRH